MIVKSILAGLQVRLTASRAPAPPSHASWAGSRPHLTWTLSYKVPLTSREQPAVGAS